MKKFLITLLTTLTLALAGCAAGETTNNNTNNNSNAEAPQSEEQQLEASVKLTKDGEEIISEESIEFEEGESLMDVMERNYDLTLDESGAFIVGIDGLDSDTENSLFWTYTVNEEEIMVGAADYILEEDDVVHFDYSKWE
ncbi:DUF4430 domain-containing protein [Sutcliffiella deserti]|uniref:DUF4430 domain-containing protein n=1 Tax=Sutcliffiella deserti TaxID=2875501 RepID=UPI001CBFC64E|nr:DUF4430 domain-containing protein [Sutcliffiella deserti]